MSKVHSPDGTNFLCRYKYGKRTLQVVSSNTRRILEVGPVKLLSNKIVRALAVIATVVFVSILWLKSDCSSTTRLDAKQLLLSKLVSQEPPPITVKVDVIYIFGGSQTSLKYKYETASELYKRGVTNRIWIFSGDRRTELSPAGGKQSSNEKWAVRTLRNLGVPEGKIEFIKVNEGFYGTYSEARDISQALIKANFNSILLISSPFHTRRIKESFHSFIKDQNVTLYISASEQKVYLRDMFYEYFKLVVYQLLRFTGYFS